MARIRFYPEDNNLHPSDHIIGTDERDGGGATRVFTLQALTDYLAGVFDFDLPETEVLPENLERISETIFGKTSTQVAPYLFDSTVYTVYGYRTTLGENRIIFTPGDILPFADSAIVAIDFTSDVIDGTVSNLEGIFSYQEAGVTRIIRIYDVVGLTTSLPIVSQDQVEAGDFSGTVVLTSFTLTDDFKITATCFGGDTVFGGDVILQGDLIVDGMPIDLAELVAIVNNNTTLISQIQTDLSLKADITDLHPPASLPVPNPAVDGVATTAVTGLSIDPTTQQIVLTRGSVPVIIGDISDGGTKINYNSAFQESIDIPLTPSTGNVIFTLVGAELTANVDLTAAMGTVYIFDQVGDVGHNVIFTEDAGNVSANVDLSGVAPLVHTHAFTELTDVNIDTATLTGGEIVYWDNTAQRFMAEPSTAVTTVEALDDLTDVVITTPTDGQILTYDLSNDRWINADAPQGFDGQYSSLMGLPVFTDGVSDLATRVVGVNFEPNTAGATDITATVDLSEYEYDIKHGTSLPDAATSILQMLFILDAEDADGRTAGLYRFDGINWVIVASHTATGLGSGVEWYQKPATGTLEVPNMNIYEIGGQVYVNDSGAAIVVSDTDTAAQAGFSQITNEEVVIDFGALAGDGLTFDTNLDVNVDDITIEIATNTLSVKDLGISTAKLADMAVTTLKIADANITTDKILDLNVTSGKIADQAITGAKLSPALPGASRILQIDDAGDLSWIEAPDPASDAMILFRDVIQAAGMDYAARILSVENSLLTFSTDLINTPEVVSLGLDTQGAGGVPTIVHWLSDGGSVADIPNGIYPVAIGKDPQEYTGFATVDLSTLDTDIITAAAGNGLVYDAMDGHLDVDVDDLTIEIDILTDKVQVKDQGITAAKLSPALPGAIRILQVDAAGVLSWVEDTQNPIGKYVETFDNATFSRVEGNDQFVFTHGLAAEDVTAQVFHNGEQILPAMLSVTTTTATVLMPGLVIEASARSEYKIVIIG